jgi:hypothetical protein
MNDNTKCLIVFLCWKQRDCRWFQSHQQPKETKMRRFILAVAGLAAVALAVSDPARAQVSASATYGVSDLSHIVADSRGNELRFNRDFKDRTFDGVVAFKSVAAASLFSSTKYRVSFGEIRNGVDCTVSDKATLDRIIDWQNGRPVHVKGTINTTLMGDVQLDDCTFN